MVFQSVEVWWARDGRLGLETVEGEGWPEEWKEG